ncbi:MAG: hypothetical protein A2527_03065 [Candidatus Lambdaproteobacteria bacterium RIFOXYD2_FULL_50_16]|uniref:Uncharacterized protein n=1 Tax=Candidatus Lambdaproteobacteria bacterium RIFOXYD2_FULL_50_16 TaxID=1817772 RepID=A0A1F6GG27_9PROT|nr:MAG: hypothetical protein A2527_03065 [Candidatus Lambdaproteobacteria bacterium RIFOXYD2_FULL_50_16]
MGNFKLWIGFGLLVLSGCSAINGPAKTKVTTEFHFLENSNNALVVFSQVSKKSINRIYLRPLPLNKLSLYTEFEPNRWVAAEIEQDGYQGKLVVLMLPAGEYEIYQWQRQELSGYLANIPWGARFKLEPKGVMYLGRFVIDGELNKSTLKVEDQSTSDLAQFKTQVPRLAESNPTLNLLPSPPSNPVQDKGGF